MSCCPPLIFIYTILISIYCIAFTTAADPDALSTEPSYKLNEQTILFENLNYNLLGRTYYGQWSVLDDMYLPSFQNRNGYVLLGFSSEYWAGQGLNLYHQLSLELYDGQYVDQDYLKISLLKNGVSPIINPPNATLIYTNVLVPISTRESDSTSINTKYLSDTFIVDFLANMSIYFINLKTARPFNFGSYQDLDDLSVQILFSSSTLNFKFVTTITTTFDPLFSSQSTFYIIVMYLFGFLEVLAYYKLYKKIKSQPTFVLNISLGTMFFLGTHDLYLFLTHVYASDYAGNSIAGSLLQSLGVIYAGIVVFFNLPFIMEVKARVSALRWENITKGVLCVSKIGFAINVVAFVLSFQAVLSQQKIFFYSIFLLYPFPQILQNYLLNKRYKWNWWYMGALPAPKVLYILYTEGYRLNIFRNTPKPAFCLVVIGSVAVQMMILIVQSRWPRMCLKSAKLYTILQSQKEDNRSCPICLEDFSDHKSKSDLEAPFLTKKNVYDSIVITPCHHEFHLACLKNWVQQKFECPYCRQILPLSNELDEASDIFESAQ